LEATFFIAPSAKASGVSSVDDIPGEPAAEPLVVASPGPLLVLTKLLGAAGSGAVSPLRDATCRSFPVWEYRADVAATLSALSEEEIEGIAEALANDPSAAGMDADLFELATLLSDLGESLRSSSDPEDRLFVLLEEKAL
jgi:hypothetical protein